MPMSPVDINNAVQYFAGKNTARLADVTANGNAPLIQQAIAPQAGTGGGGSGGGPGAALSSAQQQATGSTRDALIKGIRSGPFGMPDWMNPLGALITAGHDGKGGTSLVDDFLQSQGDSQAPQNATQKILNFLATGAYTSGEVLHKMGENVAAGNPAMEKSLAGQDVGTQILRHLGSDYIGAAGKGIAEGFGARPDGQRPNTPGSDAQQAGITGAVDAATAQGVKGLQGLIGQVQQLTPGANKALKPVDPVAANASATQLGHFAGGVTGFAADVGLDPTSYLTMGGTGLVKAGAKGAQAAGDAFRAGDNALVQGAKGFKAGATSLLGHPADLMDARSAVQAAKAARASADTPMVNLTDQVAADAAKFAPPAEAAAPPQLAIEARNPQLAIEAGKPLAPEAVATHDAINALPEADLQKLLVAEKAPNGTSALPNETSALPKGAIALPGAAAETAATGKLGTSAADLATRSAAVDKLLPTITGRLSDPVNAGSILSDAAAASKSLITDKTANAARSVLNDSSTIAEANAGISALKKTADGQRLLTQTITVGGKTRTMGDALTAAASTRLIDGTGVPGSFSVGANANADLFHAVGGAIDRAASATSKTTPASLGTAITNAGLGAPPDIGALFTKLAQTPPGAGREQIIKDALTSSTGYKNFDQAIKAATSGQVEASVMRSMLKALGIDTKATKSATLSTMLGKQGAMNWDEIQKGIPTAQEVLDNHGIPTSVNEAAAQVDPEVNAAQAAQQFEDTTASIPNVLDPATAALPTEAGKTAEAIQKGIAAYSNLEFKGPVSEKYMKEAWLTVHRSIINTLKITPNNMDLGGLSRADWLFTRYMNATQAVETHARSLGITPYLPGIPGDTSGAIYASAGQIMHALPEDLVKRALLAPVRTEAAAATAGKAGITIYPTTIGEGVKAAIDGRNPFEKMLQSDAVNASQRTPEGRQLLGDLANAITEPNFLAKMTDLHQAGRLAAVAQATKDSAAVVEPAADKILTALKNGGDRGPAVAAINDMTKSVKDMAPAGQVSLTRDMATQRADQGLVNEMGQVGAAQVRADARSATANGNKSAAQALNDQQRVAARFGQMKTKDGVPIAATPKAHTPADRALLAASAENGAAFAADTKDLMSQAADQLVAELGIDPASAMIHVGTNSYTGMVFSKFNELFNGKAGMPDLKVLQEQAQGGALAYSHDFIGALDLWLHGGHAAKVNLFSSSVKADGLGARLQAAGVFDHVPTPEEINQRITSWFAADSAHQAAAVVEKGRLLTRDELAAAMQEGRPPIGATKVGGAAPVSAAEIGMAMEWHDYHQAVFSPVNGPLQRIGVPMSDIIKQQQHFGFAQDGAHAGFGASDIGTAADMSLIPHGFDYGLMTNPVDMIANWHTSLEASSVIPAIASGFDQNFSHIAHGLTGPEALAQGYVKIQRDGPNAGFAAYLREGMYYEKHIAQQAMFMNRFMETGATAMPKFWKAINKVYDPITGVLKSSLTQWNPRHHVTNNLGNMGQQALDMIHPLYNVKALQAMRAMGDLQGADMTPLKALYQSKYLGSDKNVNPDFGNSMAKMLIKGPDGSFHKVALSPEQLYAEANKRGDTIGVHQATDRTSEGKTTLQRGLFAQFKKSKYNIPSDIGHRLGTFSSKYDSMARLAHFMAVIERGSYRSVEEGFAAASAAVHKFYPTTASLSPFEQRYARRAIFFYQWQRRALSMISDVALERPALITVPSKFQYDQANANGMQPESFGKPSGPDPRIPSYESNSTYGPTFHLGADQWGLSLQTPQLDAANSLLGGVNDFSAHNPDGPIFGFLQANLSQLNPMIKAGPELILNKNISGIGKGPRADIPGYLASQTGLPFSLATIAGLTPSTNKKLNTPQENKDAQVRALANWITGLKFTNYTNPTATAVAKKEAGLDDTQKLVDMGYTPEQVKVIKQVWKAGH
jgi:hypothetical protein